MKITVLFPLFFLVNCSYVDYFEGVITYNVEYTVFNSKVNLNFLKKTYGTKADFFYKEGNFKWQMSNAYWKSSLYLNKENKIYHTAIDTVYIENGNENQEYIVSMHMPEVKYKVHNYLCDLLVIETRPTEHSNQYRERYYYYSKYLRIDNDLFFNCNYNNLNKIYAKTKALPLKIVDRFKDFEIIYTAVEIKKQSLSDYIFRFDGDYIAYRHRRHEVER